MKKFVKLEPKHLFIFSFVLVIVVNLLILYRVYDNRTSSADSIVTLTQRELPLSRTRLYREGKYEHNKRQFFRLDWRAYDKKGYYKNYYYRSPDWLDNHKLEELGFDLDRYTPDSGYSVPRDAYIVLEVNSSMYRKHIESIEKKLATQKEIYKNSKQKMTKQEIEYIHDELDRETNMSSRLYAIDAGVDRYDLRDKYPDRGEYIILKGSIDISYQYKKDNDYLLIGRIDNISISNIHIEQKFQKVLADIYAHKKPKQKIKYRVKVAFGSRLEPYIISVEP